MENSDLRKKNKAQKGTHNESSAQQGRDFEEVVAEVAQRRKMNKSIWTDTPVIPKRKSRWANTNLQESDKQPAEVVEVDKPEAVVQQADVEDEAFDFVPIIDAPPKKPNKKIFEFRTVKGTNGEKPVLVSEVDDMSAERNRNDSSFKREVVIRKPRSVQPPVREERYYRDDRPAHMNDEGAYKREVVIRKPRADQPLREDKPVRRSAEGAQKPIMVVKEIGKGLQPVKSELQIDIPVSKVNVKDEPLAHLVDDDKFFKRDVSKESTKIPKTPKLKRKRDKKDIVAVVACLLAISGLAYLVFVMGSNGLETDDSSSSQADTKSAVDAVASQSAQEEESKAEESSLSSFAEAAYSESVAIVGDGENIRGVIGFYGSEQCGTNYAQAINKYKESLGSEVNVYNMSIPLSSAFYMPESVMGVYSNQLDCINTIASKLEDVVNCDAYASLSEHIEEDIYLKTDSNLQPLGAYYAAKAFANEAGVHFAELFQYEKLESENYVGWMYELSDYDEDINNNPDLFTYYRPNNWWAVSNYDENFENPADGYLFYDSMIGSNCTDLILGGEKIISKIVTNADNDKVLVLFKDSYGHMLVPFLTNSFSTIYVCDFKSMQVNTVDFINEVGATDVLFAMSISSCYKDINISALTEAAIR